MEQQTQARSSSSVLFLTLLSPWRASSPQGATASVNPKINQKEPVNNNDVTDEMLQSCISLCNCSCGQQKAPFSSAQASSGLLIV